MLTLGKSLKNITNTIFIATELVLLCLILFANTNVDLVCFITVCLACIHGGAFVIIRKKDYACICALAFTVISDVFLVLRYTSTGAYSDQAIAMSTFSIAQLSYFAFMFLQTENKKLRTAHVITRIALSTFAVALTLIVLKENANYMLVVTMFYFANLLLNAVFSFVEFKKFNVMAIGFVFFILCDVLIGLSIALGSIIIVPESSFLYRITFSGFNFAWLFYVISQTLLSLYVARAQDFNKAKLNAKTIEPVGEN